MENKRTGLAFSGGGVRSAALCSGVLRRLLQKGAPIDCLSSVSGGGYAAVTYMDWKYHNNKTDHPSWHKKYFNRLRLHGSPVCDCYHPCVGIVDAFINVILILFWSFGITILRAFSLLVPLSYGVDYIFGDILRAQFTCNEQNANITIPGLSREFLLRHCIPKLGSHVFVLFYLFFCFFGSFVGFYYFSTLLFKRTHKYLMLLLAQISLYGFLITFLPCFLEIYSSFTPEWCRYMVFVGIVLVWIGLPSMRDKTLLAFMVLIFAYFVRWVIFGTSLFGIQFTNQLYWEMIWAAGALLWLHPYIAMMQMYSWNRYAAFKMARTLFSPQSRSAAFDGLCPCCPVRFDKINKPLSMADLADIQPTYHCNVTVNNWRKTNSLQANDFEVLTFSPTMIQRIDRKESEEEFEAPGFLRPKDIQLSEAMLTSSAALSYDVGGFEDQNHSFRAIRILFGLGFGNIKVAQPGLTKSWLPWLVTLLLQIAFAAIIVGVPVGLYTGVLEDWTFWEQFGLIAYMLSFLLASLLAILPTGDNSTGLIDTLIRWCIINIHHVRIIRTLFGVTNVGSAPPPIMSLSDGGHVENLGILPLLKLRLQRIVVVNGGALSPEESYSQSLLKALSQARQKLRCSFVGVSGRDIEEDVRAIFVEKPPGKKPRSYRFKVYYYEMIDGVEKGVGEGEVLFLMPRHPRDGVIQYQDCKWGDCGIDLDVEAWGQGPALTTPEVGRLSGCCFECCHWKVFNPECTSITGDFPFLSILNQCLSPSQFSGYHREGYHMGMEGRADEFLADAYAEKEPHESDTNIEFVTEF